MKKFLVITLTLLCAALFSQSAAFYAQPISDSMARPQTVVLPILKRDSLLNGLQIILLESQGTGKVTAHLRINSGALFDLADKGGLADLTAGMLLEGGGGLSAKNIQDTVEQSSLSINISVDWDSTNITMSGPADSLSTIFDLLGRMIISPKFDQKDINALKSRRVTEIKSQAGNPADIVFARSMETVYGSHPYGRPMRGTAESLEKIERADLVYYHNRFYLANNSTLVISGEASLDQITPLARSKLGAWKKGEKVPATFRPPDPPAARRVVIVDRPDASLSIAYLAQTGASRRADDYFAVMILRELLKSELKKAFSGNGSAQVEIDARLLQGPVWIAVQSPNADLDKHISGVLDLMSRVQSTQPRIEDVEPAKSNLIMAFADKMRKPEGAAEIILDMELYGLGRDYLVTFADKVNAVTPADVQKAAKNYLKPQTTAIVVAGPAKQLDPTLKNLGTVTVMP